MKEKLEIGDLIICRYITHLVVDVIEEPNLKRFCKVLEIRKGSHWQDEKIKLNWEDERYIKARYKISKMKEDIDKGR